MTLWGPSRERILTGDMAETVLKGYCSRCGQERDMLDPAPLSMPARGASREAVQGVCAICGTHMFKILDEKSSYEQAH